MTTLAVLFMSLSVLGVTSLAAWCYFLVLRNENQPPSPADDEPSAQTHNPKQ